MNCPPRPTRKIRAAAGFACWAGRGVVFLHHEVITFVNYLMPGPTTVAARLSLLVYYTRFCAVRRASYIVLQGTETGRDLLDMSGQ